MSLQLKPRIIAFLSARNYTFTDLADYLEVSEDFLTKVLEDNTLEIRTLESISKALRIPLFSFFHDPARPPRKEEVPYYVMKLPEGDKVDKKQEMENLEYEIKILKDILIDKTEQLKQIKKI